MKKTIFILFALIFTLVTAPWNPGAIDWAQAAPAIKFDPKKVNDKLNAGYLDEVKPLNPQLNGTIYLRGWAQDLKQQKPTSELVVLSDGKAISAPIKAGLNRGDVAKTFNNNNLVNSGYESTFPAKILKKGKHKLEIYAHQSDGSFIPLRYKDKSFIDLTVQ